MNYLEYAQQWEETLMRIPKNRREFLADEATKMGASTFESPLVWLQRFAEKYWNPALDSRPKHR